MRSIIFIIVFSIIITLSYSLFALTTQASLITFNIVLSRNEMITKADQTIAFTLSSAWGPGETLIITYADDFSLLPLYVDGFEHIDLEDDSVDLTLAATAGNGASSAIGVAVDGQKIIFTQNNTDAVAVGSEIIIEIGQNAQDGVSQIVNPSITDDYLITLSGTFGDNGSVAVAIVDNDAVFFEGNISPILSLVIRNSTDTTTTNNCLLGEINSIGVSTCSYRLAASTNAGEGFQIYLESDGEFHKVDDATKYISAITEGSTVSAGTEKIGIAVTAGTSNQNGTVLTEYDNGDDYDFTDDDTPVPGTTPKIIVDTDEPYFYSQGDTTTSTLITHRASILANSTLPEGSYQHYVVYSIVANF